MAPVFLYSSDTTETDIAINYSLLYSNPAILVRLQLRCVLVGGNGDGGIQLQPDDGSARLQLGGGWWRQRRNGLAFDSVGF